MSSHHNDRYYHNFLNRGWQPNWGVHPERSPLEVVLIEPRNHPNLRGVMENMSCLLPYASFTMIHSNKNADTIHSILGESGTHNVRTLNILPDNITRDEYSEMLTSKEFWSIFHAPKVFIYQTDSGMRHNNVLRFMEYDYIGAPWPWAIMGDTRIQQGNGGFSIRSSDWMKQIASTYNFSVPAYESEDIFFAKHMHDSDDANVATRTEASMFSVEFMPHEHPMGFHQAWKLYPESYVKTLLETNLDPISSVPDIQIKDAWIETEHGREVVVDNLVEFVKLGIGSAGLRISQNTILPITTDPYPGMRKFLKLGIQYNGRPQLYTVGLDRKRVQQTLFVDASENIV